MLDTTYSSGVVKYTIEFTPSKKAGNWAPVILLGSSNKIMLRSDASKAWGYSANGSDTFNALSSEYSTSKTTVTFIFDFINNKISLVINGTTIQTTAKAFEVKGLSFMTAKTDTERSFVVNSIKIEKAE